MIMIIQLMIIIVIIIMETVCTRPEDRRSTRSRRGPAGRCWTWTIPSLSLSRSLSRSLSLSLSLFVCVYIYRDRERERKREMYTHTVIHIYIYIYTSLSLSIYIYIYTCDMHTYLNVEVWEPLGFLDPGILTMWLLTTHGSFLIRHQHGHPGVVLRQIIRKECN